MDITKFVVSRRNDALLVGDYGSYRKQLSRRLLVVRRRLGRISPKNRKYAQKAPITAEDVSSNLEFIHLLLLTSERAWAHALHMKSMRSAESTARAITGSTKKHIISRLHKAEAIAAHLVEILKANEQAPAHSRALLEARAYYCMIRGALEFETHKWEKCLEAYSEAHLLYTSFGKSLAVNQGDPFTELLSSTIDPSIRYAAYQLRLPRTLSITRIVSQFYPKDSAFVRGVLEQYPDLLKEGSAIAKAEPDGVTRELPKTISWRKRTLNLEDANIAQALAAVSEAKQKLASTLASSPDMPSKEKGAAYDQVLAPSQDAVDATKTAIDELTADGVAQGDPRMQSLQITRTAVNYALVGWRIGRNRVLCGKHDGAYLDLEIYTKSKRPRKDGTDATLKDESNGKKLARLRERVTLYDTITQSLDSVKELPGVAADQSLMEELESQRAYFTALRCLAIARSHNLLSSSKNALALFARASNILSNPSTSKYPSINRADKLVNIEVTQGQANATRQLLEGLVAQHRALVEIENITAEATKSEKSKAIGAIPMIERLDDYPKNGADLNNLVIYPPKLRPLPVKPLFLDVASTYIEYPGKEKKGQEGLNTVVESGKQKVEEKKEGRKGWFGFGR
ncbi:hypothetical protein MMC30_008930 [Trapelia coarctata]|nr:hypothetical protein [Trapelia coarctata]